MGIGNRNSFIFALVITMSGFYACDGALSWCKPGTVGWYRRDNSNYCYRLSSLTESENWDNARQACKSWDMDSDLVSIESETELNWVRQFLQDRYGAGTPRVWTSGNDLDNDDVWRWQYGGQVNGNAAVAAAWAPGEPNDTGSCMAMVRTGAFTSGWRFWDRYCSSSYRFLCEINRNNLEPVFEAPGK